MLPTLSPTSLLQPVIRTREGDIPAPDAACWQIGTIQEEWAGPGTRVCVRATWQGDDVVEAGLLVRLPLEELAITRLLVPAVFYDDNGPGSRSTHYPHLGPLDRETLTAPAWDFGAERTALPAVFAWTAGAFHWLAVEPSGTGIGFSTVPGECELRAHRPALSLPFKHDRAGEDPSTPLVEVAPGEALELVVWCGSAAPGDPLAYVPVQRALQVAWGGSEPRAVELRMLRDAADAAAEGLMRWHYLPPATSGQAARGRSDVDRPAVLAETVSFDGSRVREEMHVAWISGAPTAYALLRHGVERGDSAAAAAGRAVLDTVAGGLAPCGAFWGNWTPSGWRAGWNGHPHKLHARTLAEATLFMLRALAFEPGHLLWDGAARSNLEFCLRSLDRQGHPGSYYHALTGQVLDRRGTAGLLWAAALAEGSRVLGAPAYLEAALRVGDAYAGDIRDGRLLGAPEDIGLCPSSEDGYNALIATMALYEGTAEDRWLDLAKAAAAWMLTFRWSYDVRFPPGSPLDRRGFRTTGADGASPSNIHLHDYGLIAQPELLRLAALAGDPWYAGRAADHLACFAGEVALRDGAFGGPERRGMMPEQWYTADWSLEGRAGEVGEISHAWCLGLFLRAAEDWLTRLDAPVSPSSVAAPPKKPARARRPRFAYDKPHPVRLFPGLYQIGGGFMSNPGDASSYALVDESTGECLVVDCGSHRGLAAMRANLEQVADLKQLRYVVATHGHFDHVEAFGHLRPETAALFAIHESEVELVRTGDPDLTCAGFLYGDTFHTFAEDFTLKGGERFAVGKYELEVLHLPGHSPGCVALKARFTPSGQTILIPGDAISGGFSRRIRSSVPAWKKSMRRLMDQEIDFIVPTHMPGSAQTSLLADVRNRLARVYRQLELDFHEFQLF